MTNRLLATLQRRGRTEFVAGQPLHSLHQKTYSVNMFYFHNNTPTKSRTGQTSEATSSTFMIS